MTKLSRIETIKETLFQFVDRAPVDVEELARQLGLEVIFFHDWREDIAGAISKEDGKVKIYVNGDDAPNRQRFTIAHEIAHSILHLPYIDEGIVDDKFYRSSLHSSLEAQANDYALTILIPANLLEDHINNGIKDVKKLAKIFEVSPDTISLRLGFPAGSDCYNEPHN